MVAAAFKVTMILKLPNGAPKHVPLTVSDVNGEFAVHPSGGTEVVLHGSSDCYVTDMILSAAGTDTSQMELFINGASTGIKLLNATSLATTVARPFASAPIRIPAGAMVKWKQLT